MPQTRQSAKALRQSRKRTARLQPIRMEIKTRIKKCRQAVDEKDAKSLDLIKDVIKKIDKAAQKGIIKKNTAARRKSRLMQRYNKSQKVAK